MVMILMIQPMLRVNVFLILTILCVEHAKAQFTDSTNYLVQYTSAGSINTTEENDAYLLNNALRLGIRKKTISLNFNNNWIYGKQNQQLTNNDFSSTLDFNLYKLPTLCVLGFSQLQYQ
jgi:hypothetical protein